MKLDRVTVTGADDSIDPYQLWQLSRDFPFVEWALLFRHQSSESKPRWPSRPWVNRLLDFARSGGTGFTPRFALHLVGMPLHRFLHGSRGFLATGDGCPGYESVPAGLLQLCRRMQLNTHGEPFPRGALPAISLLWREQAPLTDILCQIDGGGGARLLEDMLAEEMDAYPFYDLSHGAGVLPSDWPRNDYETHPGSPMYAGYGGGLGPGNLAAEIPRIAEAARGRFWIDMETRVRSTDFGGKSYFDLAKVRRCLEIAAPFVEARHA